MNNQPTEYRITAGGQIIRMSDSEANALKYAKDLSKKLKMRVFVEAYRIIARYDENGVLTDYDTQGQA